MQAALLKTIASVLLGIMLVISATAEVQAHAVLLSTNPSDGTVMDTAPDTLTLSFNEPVSVLIVSLITPAGERIDLTKNTESGQQVVINLPDALKEGTHVVSWRVASVDGHPVGGALAFSIGIVTKVTEVATGSDVVVDGLLWMSKVIVYLAIFIGMGGSVFGGAIYPLSRVAVTTVKTAVLFGLVFVPVSLSLHGMDALGLGLGDVFSQQSFAAGFSTTYGLTAAMLLCALAFSQVSLMLHSSKSAGGLAIAGLLLASLAIASSGHAAAADPQWVTRPAVALHIAGIMFWVGALVPLLSLMRDAGNSTALTRFSNFIPYPVGIILLSGTTLGVIQLGWDVGSWMSPYGYILAGKLFFLAILFSLALWNRLVLTGRVLSGNKRAILHLKISIVVEIVLVVAILGLVSGWRFTPPPRALALSANAPLTFLIHGSSVLADTALEPGKLGANTVVFSLADHTSKPIEPISVTVSVSSPKLGIEAVTKTATFGNDGKWHVESIEMPLSGEWKFTLEVRLSRFEMERLEHTFTLH